MFTGELLTPRLGVGAFNTGNVDYELNVEGAGRFTDGLIVVGGLTATGNLNLTGGGSTSLSGTLGVTGNVSLAGNISLADDKLLKFGVSDDLTIQHHNSGYGHLQNTGTLYLDCEVLSIRTDNSAITERVSISAAGATVISGTTMNMNYGSVAVNSTLTVGGALLPAANGTHNLGSSGAYWKNAYLEDTAINGTLWVGGLTTLAGALTGTRGVFSAASGTNYALHLKNTTAASCYTCWIEEPASPTAGYPLLNVTSSGGINNYFRIDSGTGSSFFGGAVYNSSGTVSAPSISFTGDTDTGIWRPGSNQLWFVTTGVNRIKIDGSGNTEITGALTAGTASTSNILYGYTKVEGDGLSIHRNVTGAQPYLVMQDKGTTIGYMYAMKDTNSRNSFEFRNLAQDKKPLLIDFTNNRLGVGGVSSPTCTLDVNGAGNFSGALTAGGNITTGGQILTPGGSNLPT